MNFHGLYSSLMIIDFNLLSLKYLLPLKVILLILVFFPRSILKIILIILLDCVSEIISTSAK